MKAATNKGELNMGLLKRTVNFARFKADPNIKLQLDPNVLTTSAFQDEEEAEEVSEQSFGWVSFENSLSTDFQNCVKGNYVVLSLRVDTRNVPYHALQMHFKKALQEKQTSLSKEDKKVLKEAVKMKLLKRAIPRTNIYDVSWNLTTGSVLFTATSDKVCGLFEALFFEAFGQRLERVFPYTMCKALTHICVG